MDAAATTEWTRYLARQARSAARNVTVKTETAERYGWRSLTEMHEDDLNNYARALQELAAARRAQRDADAMVADFAAFLTDAA